MARRRATNRNARRSAATGKTTGVNRAKAMEKIFFSPTNSSFPVFFPRFSSCCAPLLYTHTERGKSKCLQNRSFLFQRKILHQHTRPYTPANTSHKKGIPEKTWRE
uniref:Uncharacterized protein n=1 Tax=Trypanosoma congolense (strain IL3000) TaxID=1068625 RepID=G0UZH9_TRYCI|nr:hypothetical protein, unlikely [Trypanosoma congolense IL3000]